MDFPKTSAKKLWVLRKSNSLTGLLVLLLGLTNAILYCCSLPLWEGFDEPFHYAYVESLSIQHRFPVLNQSRISREIRESFNETPISRLLEPSFAGSVAFENWFRLSPEERLRRKAALARIPPQLREQPSAALNYEAQQAPLAYLLLAPFDALLSSLHLTQRILILRLLAAISGTVLVFFATNLLCDAITLREPFRIAVLACIFETQMFWAAVAHVGNDWLAIPAVTWFFAAAALLIRDGQTRYALLLAISLTVGLLAKAYCLAFVPVFVGILLYEYFRSRLNFRMLALTVAIPVLVAGPWYLRNYLLYGSLSGMQEVVHGVTLSRALTASFHINWLATAMRVARWSLWTGNWSFTAFSRSTLNFELLLIALAFIFFFTRYKQIGRVEVCILVALAAFSAALAYYICVAWVDTHGISTGAEPWYAQCIMPAVFALSFLGLQRTGIWGRVVASLLCVISAWIAALTYVAKLFPFYGGYSGRSTPSQVLGWWRSDWSGALSSVLFTPVPLVCGLLACFLVLLAAVTVFLLVHFYRHFDPLAGRFGNSR